MVNGVWSPSRAKAACPIHCLKSWIFMDQHVFLSRPHWRFYILAGYRGSVRLILTQVTVTCGPACISDKWMNKWCNSVNIKPNARVHSTPSLFILHLHHFWSLRVLGLLRKGLIYVYLTNSWNGGVYNMVKQSLINTTRYYRIFLKWLFNAFKLWF